jgi:hypothetical protein
MSTAKTLAALSLATLALQADASVIKLQTGYSNAGPQNSAAAYRDVVNAAIQAQAQNNTFGYGTRQVAVYDNLSNKALFGTDSNIAWKATIDFGVTAAQAGLWSFRTGVDFDRGGAIFLDGVALDFRNNNMWWGGNYNASTQFLAGSRNLAAGNHTLTIFGLEGCCDGGEQAQFRIGSGQFTTFASTDGLRAVPEPVTMASVGLGLGLLGLSRRRKRA